MTSIIARLGLISALLISLPAIAHAGVTVKTDNGLLSIDPLTQSVDNPDADVIFDGGVYYFPSGVNVHIKARSLQLLHGATLVLGGDNAVIEVRRVVSQQGAIVSFDGPHRTASSGASGTTAGIGGEPGVNGANGGSITLLADAVIAQSPLILDESGQDGGLGGAGAKGAKGSTGPKGTPALAQRDPHGPDNPYPQWHCVQAAGPGGKGGTGGAGGDGGLGGQGGAGGVITIVLRNAGDVSHIKAIAAAGRGNFGGPGGARGDGGDPGPGGAAAPDVCQGGPPGAAGDPGTPGKDHTRDRSADGHPGIISLR